MKLLFKQRFFSWFDSYDIYNEAGQTVYTVKGQLAWGHCLKIYDAQSREIGTVKERILTWLPKFEMYLGDRYIGCISKEFTFFKPEYNVYGPDWKVVGDFWDHDYEVYDGKAVVAHVYKEWFTWGDAYTINFGFGADEVMALSVVLVIDACIEAQRNN